MLDTLTNRSDCCRGSNHPEGVAQGHWYCPDGSEVMSFTAEDAARPEPNNFFSRSRITGVVRLNRNGKIHQREVVFTVRYPMLMGVNVNLFVNIGEWLYHHEP